MISPQRQSFIHAAWVIRSVVRSTFIWLSSNCRYIIVTTVISRSEIASRARDNWKKIKVATQRMRQFFPPKFALPRCVAEIASGRIFASRLDRCTSFERTISLTVLTEDFCSTRRAYDATLISVINCCTPDRTVQLVYERRKTRHSTLVQCFRIKVSECIRGCYK